MGRTFLTSDAGNTIPNIPTRDFQKATAEELSSTHDVLKTIAKFKENSPEWQATMLQHLLNLKREGHEVKEETLEEVRFKFGKRINDNYLIIIFLL